MPHRNVLDFLVQYFIYELNWMKQVLYAPGFLARYQQWWAKDRSVGSADDVEFTALVATRDKESPELAPVLSSHGSSGSSTFPSNLLGLDSDWASWEQ
ncbi:hypothetical protein PHISP_02632 [Aspergillus sp. HF37]|nr:hypothetical protein PHISP_02632 [Aspergillus sp. HF37]